MKKYTYLIEPIAPLVFRSAKPFGSLASVQDVVFPYPSTASGLVRAVVLEQSNGTISRKMSGLQDPAYQQLLSIKSQGPFLVRYHAENKQDMQILVPKPTNALYFEDKNTGNKLLVRLNPKPYDDTCGSDIPKGLIPVQMEQHIKGKPFSGIQYWTLQHFISWQKGENLTYAKVEEQGLAGLPIEIRTHNARDDERGMGRDGQLFQTASFDLSLIPSNKKWQGYRLGFAVNTDNELADDMVTFGGEQRLSYFTQCQSPVMEFPDFVQLANDINKTQGFSIAFLTPCIFAQGFLPGWIDQHTMEGILPNTSIRVKLESLAIDRWVGVSGWDSVLQKPKAMRKAVGCGSVYWFRLLDGMFDESIVKQLWMESLADHAQDKYDGFGVITLAPYQSRYQ